MPMAAGTPTRPDRAILRREATWGATAAVVALAVAAWSLRLWAWDPANPIDLGYDNTQISMALKTIHEHGWYWTNPDLGFPFGQTESWFPELNVLHVGLIKVLGLLLPGAFTAGSVYFVLSFPLTAVTMYLLARSQGLGRPAGLLTGVLLANAPGHSERFGHLYLAQYWVVPVALWLVLEVLRGRALLSRDAEGRTRWRGARTLTAVAAVVVVGFSGVYYVAFTLVLLAVAAVARRTVGSPADLFRGLTVMLGTAVCIGLPLAASRLGTRGQLVTGQLPAQRNPAESELYAGKLMDLVLPWPHHRVPALEFLTFAYGTANRATVEVSALGVVGTVGLAGLAVSGLLALLVGRRQRPDHARWSGLMLVSFLLYTVGGLGSFIALFGTPQVRTWSRMSIYLLALALLAVGAWLTRVERRRGVLVAGALAAALTVVGALDQTNPAAAPDHAAISAEMAGLRTYTSALEDRLGAGCAVFQAPVVPYPETRGPVDSADYDQLKPYLAGADLRWSAGAMRGTAAADWMLGVDAGDLRALAGDLRSVGFCALEVDTEAFTAAQDPTARLTDALGDPVATTPDGTFVAWDLRAAGAAGEDDRARRTRTLEPVVLSVGGYEPEVVDGTLGRYLGPYGTVSVANLGPAAEVAVTMSVEGVGPEPREVVVTRGGQEVARVTTSRAHPAELAFTVPAARGRTVLSLEVTGPREKERRGDRVPTAFVSDVRVSGPQDRRVVALLTQVGTGWVVP